MLYKLSKDLEEQLKEIRPVTTEQLVFLIAKREPNIFLKSELEAIEEYKVGVNFLKEYVKNKCPIYDTIYSNYTMKIFEIAYEKAIENGNNQIEYENLKEVVMQIDNPVWRFLKMDYFCFKENSIHEASHYIVDKYLINHEILYLSILPNEQGEANMTLKEKFEGYYTEERLINEIAVCIAGSIGTEMAGFYGSKGCDSDFQEASGLALDIIQIYRSDSNNYLEEFQLIKQEAYNRAYNVLLEHFEEMFLISKKLLKQGFILGEELNRL